VVRIRMQRLGRRHRPFFRINAIDQRTRQRGRVIENLGWHDPLAAGEQLHLKEDRIRHWLSKGAQPSDTMMDVLGKAELLPERMKAQWESDRAAAKARVSAKVSLKKAEAAVAAIAEFKDADTAPFLAEANAALKSAQAAVSAGDIGKAEQAAAEAEAQGAACKSADEEAKAKKAAEEAKAAEAKAAEEAAAAEASEGEAGE